MTPSEGQASMRWLFGDSRRQRRLRAASLLAISAGLVFALLVMAFDPLHPVQRVIADAQFRAEDGSPNVVLVGIDDAALQKHGRLQEWSRSLHARVIRNLNGAGAQVIIYDVLFADPSQADADLAQAISESEKVILPVAGDAAPSAQNSGYVFQSFTLPTKTLRESGPTLADASLISDGDGRVRSVPLSVSDVGGQTYTSVSLAAVYRQFGRQVSGKIAFSGDRFDLFGRTVPLGEHETLRINYVGGQDRFSTIAFDRVLEGNFEPTLVQNKIVIVGMLATAADVHSAPLLGSAHGMEIHANAIDTLLRARFLRTTSGTVTLATVILLALLAALIVPRWRPLFGLATVVILAGMYVILGMFMFNQGRIIDFVNPPIGLALATVTALSYAFISERGSQREMQELFGRYVSPQVAKELLDRADRGQLRLGGELREVTILFADIRGFTPLSARMLPEELVGLLNRHFDIVVSRIMQNGGIVNKFAGDAVMAFWNAPGDQAEHALLACRASLEAQEALDSLSGPGPIARWGFGINTGQVLAGNVGSGKRLEYTVIGDSVNLAARLAGVAPGGEVWVGVDTFRLIKDSIDAEELPAQQIKGIEAPVVAYRLKRPLST